MEVTGTEPCPDDEKCIIFDFTVNALGVHIGQYSGLAFIIRVGQHSFRTITPDSIASQPPAAITFLHFIDVTSHLADEWFDELTMNGGDFHNAEHTRHSVIHGGDTLALSVLCIR